MEQKKDRKGKWNIAGWISAGRKRMIGLAIVAVLLLCAGTYAVGAASYSRYETLHIASSSLNGNTIWGSTESYRNANLDGYGAFYSSARNASGGLPTNGALTVGDVPYQLANNSSVSAYDGNDSIRLTNGSPSRTIYLDTYGSYEKIYVLGTAGGPGASNYANFKVTLTYTDNSTDITTYRLYDWYNTGRTAGVEKYNGVRRILISNGSFDGSTYGGPVLQSATINSNPSKLLKSVTFTLAGVNDSSSALNGKRIYCGVYAVTGAVNGNAPETPVITATSDIYGAGFTADWDEVKGADCYYLDVSETPDFSSFVGAYNNKKIDGTTAHIDKLRNGTRYYCRVRAANSHGSSLSSNVASVVTYVPNIAIVNLTLDGGAYTDQTVTLQSGSQTYTLYENSEGSYRNEQVANGTYQIFVNGVLLDEKMTFDYHGTDMNIGDTKVQDVAFDTLHVMTRLNNTDNSLLGDIALCKGEQVMYTGKNVNGTADIIVKEGTESGYRVLVGGVDTQKTIEVRPNASVVIDYYELTLALAYERLLDDADVTLCNGQGSVLDTLPYKNGNGQTAYYCKIVQKDDSTVPVSYDVYVNGQNTHKSISAVDGRYKADAEFYRAAMTITVDGDAPGNLQVTMTNGEESYSLLQDGTDFVNEFTLKNTSVGGELPYAVSVDTTLYPEEFTISSASPQLQLVYYTVKYQIPVSDGWTVYDRQIVRNGQTALQPSDPQFGGVEFKNWYLDEETEEIYDFNTEVTAPVVLYAAFETPSIVINGYVKTDASGKTDAKGSYYCMPNLTISGYEAETTMKSVVFETTGCSEILFLSDDVIETVSPTLTAASDAAGKVSLSGKGTVLVTLKEGVTMGRLQQFLRESVIVKPKAGTEHTMQITVFGN